MKHTEGSGLYIKEPWVTVILCVYGPNIASLEVSCVYEKNPTSGSLNILASLTTIFPKGSKIVIVTESGLTYSLLSPLVSTSINTEEPLTVFSIYFSLYNSKTYSKRSNSYICTKRSYSLYTPWTFRSIRI